jgi:hypothetical protein
MSLIYSEFMEPHVLHLHNFADEKKAEQKPKSKIKHNINVSNQDEFEKLISEIRAAKTVEPKPTTTQKVANIVAKLNKVEETILPEIQSPNFIVLSAISKNNFKQVVFKSNSIVYRADVKSNLIGNLFDETGEVLNPSLLMEIIDQIKNKQIKFLNLNA